MDYGEYYWELYRDYGRDPIPHSLLTNKTDVVTFMIQMDTVSTSTFCEVDGILQNHAPYLL